MGFSLALPRDLETGATIPGSGLFWQPRSPGITERRTVSKRQRSGVIMATVRQPYGTMRLSDGRFTGKRSAQGSELHSDSHFGQLVLAKSLHPDQNLRHSFDVKETLH
ncbi:hypothetical protein [Metapseudomonas otitidis]|uniref:hypothetical protein n=1 Tax=Metapseudomonas otitidis TaxID=319939 RepID=UPI001F48FA86|nr:hypothetical protein [Pseudomonas otitidis]